MRLKAVLYSTYITTSIILSLNSPHLAQAQNRPKIVKVSEIFVVQSNNQAITCAKVKGKWLPGTLRSNGSSFISDNARLNVLRIKIKLAKEPLLSKLNKKLKRQRTRLKANLQLCEAGPPAVPTPPAIPNPPAPAPIDPLKPLARSLTKADIQHLFRRAALGYVSPQMLNLGLTQGAAALVTELYRKKNDNVAEQQARSWLAQGNVNQITTATGVKYYALLKPILTQNPLRMQLCMIHLHDILAVSVNAVNTSGPYRELMVKYFDTLCSVTDHGSYRDLIKDITLEPAMLFWLDGNSNNKLQPNENYARELMELFTVGVFNKNGQANYTDLDVATAARALTGLGVINSAQFGISTIFNYAAFDNANNKQIFRSTSHQSSVYDWEALVDHIFDQHPNTAYNIALMLAERYVRPDIAKTKPLFVQALANDLKANNFNIMSTLYRLLISEEFYKTENRNTILRSPAEITIHLMRALKDTGMPHDINPMTPANILAISTQGGMELADPPTVFGWDRDKEFVIGSRFLSMTNRITTLLGSSTFNSEDNATGWNYKKLYPPDITAPSAQQVISHISDLLGVSLNVNQNNLLLKYMNTQLRQTFINGQLTFEEAEDPWQPASYAQARRKLSGIIRIILGTNEFRVY